MAATRVALYTRVSTEDQAKEGFSLAAQLERLRYYAKAHGWPITGEYVDEGKSARTIGRKKYQKMMDNRADWDMLLVLKIDRIHRNAKNFRSMMDFLKQEGKAFASLMESIETKSAAGSFVVDTLARLAELGSDTIAENVVMGMQQKYREKPGIYQNGSPPWGYKVDSQKKLVVQKATVPTVRYIFSMADRENLTATQIVTRLKNEHLSRAPHAFNWQWPHVMRILTNPVYCGDLVFGEHFTMRDYYPAIVSRQLFKRVNLKFARHLAASSPEYFHSFHERNRGRRLDPDVVRQVRGELAKGEVEPYRFKVPMGYELSMTGLLTEVPKEMKVIRYVFAAFHDAGLNREQIATRLEEGRVPRPMGGPWHGHTIERILTQRFYMGEWKYRGYTYETRLKPAVPRARFIAVQRKLQGLKELQRKRHRYGLSDFKESRIRPAW